MNNKLTWQQVQRVKELLAAGWKNKEVAAEFGVKPNTISDIKLNKTWQVGSLSRKQVARVKLLLSKGMRVEKIAEGFGVAPKVITHIKLGMVYPDVAPEGFEGEAWQMPNPIFL